MSPQPPHCSQPVCALPLGNANRINDEGPTFFIFILALENPKLPEYDQVNDNTVNKGFNPRSVALTFVTTRKVFPINFVTIL